MAHKDIIERRKENIKPRGRPFQKGNRNGKLENEVLDASGHQIGVEGGVVVSDPLSVEQEAYKEESSVFDGFYEKSNKALQEIMNETLQEESVIRKEKTIIADHEKSKNLTLLESIDFVNGPNKLSIKFSKKNNRMFRIQIFLNDEDEIRPTTYSGSSTAKAFWDLLKRSFKK